MSLPPAKPPRKTLRLKPAAAAGQPRAKHKPLRWSPLQKDRSLAPKAVADAPPPAAVPAVRSPARPPARPGPGAAAQRRRPKPKPPAAARLSLFCPCPRGLEAQTAQELADLGAAEVEPASGGVGCAGDLVLAWKINLWSRLAIRVLWRVAAGPYRREEDLYDAALALPWSDWFGHDKTLAVRTVAHDCALKSLNFVTLKIKDAVCDRFRQDHLPRPDVEPRDPDVPILNYLERDRFSLYLDLSGAPLNRRGYRVEPAPAPLNENLAAGLLKLSGWTPQRPLLDPMMGGGTILLEAAMLALNMAPGLKRHFAFENLAGFDKVEWTRLRKDAEAAQGEKRALPLYGCDLDPNMVRAAGLNFKAAGLLDCVTLREGDVLAIPAPAEAGLIVSNPPYGIRLAVGRAASTPRDGEVRPADFAVFYRALGDALKQRFTGWTAHLLSADPDLPRQIGLKATRRTPLYNGPLECRLYEYRIEAGSLRSR